MRNLLNKINLNRTRTIYFLATFVMIIGCYALNKSYSMFVQNESKKAVGATVPIMTSDLSVNSVTLNANQEMLVKQTITNTGSTAINYGINTSGSNYTAKLTSDSDIAVTGTLNSSANKVLYFYLKNNSSSSNKVSFTLNKNYTTVATKKPTSNISTSNKYNITKTSNAIPYSNEPNTLKYKILYNFVNSSIYTGGKPSTTSTTAATEFNSRKAYISNNKGKSSTTATTTLQFTTTSAGKLNFDYFVSSESASFDYLTITLQKDSGTAETILDKTGGENKSGSISKDLVSGSTYKLTFNYRKDGSVDKYDDLAYIENLDITATLNSSGITNPSNGTYKFVQTTPNKISLPLTSGSATFQSPTSFTAVETAEKGLYQAEDDYGTTYYFRGASTKNYLKLSGTNKKYNFVSNNQNQNSTTATSTIKFTPTQSGTMTFDWSVASETNYDKFTVKLNDTVVTDTSNVSINAVSGTKSGKVSMSVTSGTLYTLVLTYSKDNSNSSNGDTAKIENLFIPSNPTLTVTDGSYKFAKTDVGGDTIWRIVRINGDGSIRLVLDSSAGTSAFNTSYNDNAYVGYMYGLTGQSTVKNQCIKLNSAGTAAEVDTTKTTESACTSAGYKWTTTPYDATHVNVVSSTVKKSLDTWYETNIKGNGLESYIADTLFCNDKTLASNGIGGVTTQLGYGTNKTYYASTERLVYSTGTTSITTAKPTFKCAESATNDYSRFTVDVATLANGNKTNGNLKYPIGLLSADEVSYAGAYKLGQTNKSYYLYNTSITSNWWLLFPCNFFGSSAGELGVNGSIGSIYNSDVYNSYAFRPSINLKADSLINGGDGTSSNPYTVKLS